MRNNISDIIQERIEGMTKTELQETVDKVEAMKLKGPTIKEYFDRLQNALKKPFKRLTMNKTTVIHNMDDVFTIDNKRNKDGEICIKVETEFSHFDREQTKQLIEHLQRTLEDE